MARNWDEHYANATSFDSTPSPLLVEVGEWTQPGRALDLACGSGRNALYLASLAWHVTAVDSSREAIRIVGERSAAAGLEVDAQVADIESSQFVIEPSEFDLICDFFYLDRRLFPQIRQGVRPGGIVAAEIHLRDDAPHRFVVEAGELRREFDGWKILYYSEGRRDESRRPSARILARRA